jgi:hypothetical protein
VDRARGRGGGRHALTLRRLVLHGSQRAGKPRAFLPYAGGLDVYRRRCDEVAASGYDGFVLSQRAATPG